MAARPMAAQDAAIERQRTIWTSLYGPARAGVLVERLAALQLERPELPLREAVAVVDPEDLADYEDFVATRW